MDGGGVPGLPICPDDGHGCCGVRGKNDVVSEGFPRTDCGIHAVVDDNTRQHQSLDLHLFKNGVQLGANERAVLLFGDDGFSPYRRNFFLDAIPRAMDVIAGGRRLLIVLDVNNWPAV